MAVLIDGPGFINIITQEISNKKIQFLQSKMTQDTTHGRSMKEPEILHYSVVLNLNAVFV